MALATELVVGTQSLPISRLRNRTPKFSRKVLAVAAATPNGKWWWQCTPRSSLWEAVLAEVGTEPASSRKVLAMAAATLDRRCWWWWYMALAPRGKHGGGSSPRSSLAESHARPPPPLPVRCGSCHGQLVITAGLAQLAIRALVWSPARTHGQHLP